MAHPGRRRQRTVLAGLVAFAAMGAAGAAVSTPPRSPSDDVVVELRIDGEIEPAMAEFVGRALGEAAADHARLALITIDTPGGLSDSMQAIIQAIIDSPVPVAVYVSPAGTRAASAGFFILQSADVAAMAPGTHTGAASPLLAIGGVPISVDATVEHKIMNDATAYMRSLVTRRGRNVAAADSAVTDGTAFTDDEALHDHLIDLVAPSVDALLTTLNGRTVTRFDGRTTTLDLTGVRRTVVDMTSRERFLAWLVQPNVFFLLLIGGVLGLYVEFTHPGLVLPGTAGGIALLLALYSMNLLPVSLAGVLLVALGLVLFVLEAHAPSHGVLGAGGVVSMLLGATLLIRSPLTPGGVSPTLALGVTIPCAVIMIVLMRLVIRSRAWAPATGVGRLVGAVGEVVEPLTVAAADGLAHGQARIEGELWRAVSPRVAPAGTRVRVVRVDGLTLYVESASPAPPPEPSR